jgi:threonine synthase
MLTRRSLRAVGYHSADVTARPSAVMSGARLRVAVLGAGTVGREVVAALRERPDELRPADGTGLELVAVAVRDGARALAAGVPADLLSDAPAHLVADERIDVIVELMGGDEPAHTLIAAALSMGKSVVTANKHVIAHHGPELEAIARRTGAPLRFEAAVGGGIPSSGRWRRTSRATASSAVRGIVNGTTNFILSAMTDEDDAVEFAAALAEAQRLGYAEADPSGDVEGHDAVNKLVILARLAFDRGWTRRRSRRARRRRRTGRPGHHDGQPRRPGRRPCGRADHPARGHGRADARRRPRGAVLPTALPLDSALGRTAACATASRSTRRRSAASVRRSRRGRPGHLVGRPRRPRSPSPCAGSTWGPRAAARADPASRVTAPRRLLTTAAASGTRSMTEQGRSSAPRPRLMERYRASCRSTDATPPLTLGEGFTPLVRAARLGAALGLRDLHLKVEGQNPTGSFKDRGMVVAVAKAVEAGRGRSSAPRPATRRRRLRPTARRPGIEVIVVLPRGQIAIGKLLQALIAGARVVAIDGNFDQALSIVRALAEQDDHPVTLVNSVNPFRLEGQKTAAFEICDDLGRAPDVLAIPVGNAGNISAYWAGFSDYAGGQAHRLHAPMWGFQAAGAAPLVVGHRIDRPETVATAIRIGDPASWTKAIDARGRAPAGGSAPSPTRRSWPRTGHSRASRASSASLRLRRASPGS